MTVNTKKAQTLPSTLMIVQRSTPLRVKQWALHGSHWRVSSQIWSLFSVTVLRYSKTLARRWAIAGWSMLMFPWALQSMVLSASWDQSSAQKRKEG